MKSEYATSISNAPCRPRVRSRRSAARRVMAACAETLKPALFELGGKSANILLPETGEPMLTDFGMAMGIFAVDDMAGLDVGWRCRQELGHFTDPAQRKPLVDYPADRFFTRRLALDAGQRLKQGVVGDEHMRQPLERAQRVHVSQVRIGLHDQVVQRDVVTAEAPAPRARPESVATDLAYFEVNKAESELVRLFWDIGDGSTWTIESLSVLVS